MSSGDNKIPGIRKNDPLSQEKNFMDLTDDEQRQLLTHELQNWQLNNLNIANVPHNIFNMDAMLIALVRVMSQEIGVSEDRLNRHYRQVTYEKLVAIRKDAVKSRIVVPGDIQV